MPPPYWPKVEIEFALQAASRAHGVPLSLLRAVAYVESGFDPAAVSDKGAVGLMQLMPDTARQYGVNDLRDAKQNADGGAAFLAQLLKAQQGDTIYALQAYNWGPMRWMQARAKGEQAPLGVKTYALKVVAMQKLYDMVEASPKKIEQLELFANKTGQAGVGVGAALFFVLLFVYFAKAGNGHRRGGADLLSRLL